MNIYIYKICIHCIVYIIYHALYILYFILGIIYYIIILYMSIHIYRKLLYIIVEGTHVHWRKGGPWHHLPQPPPVMSPRRRASPGQARRRRQSGWPGRRCCCLCMLLYCIYTLHMYILHTCLILSRNLRISIREYCLLSKTDYVVRENHFSYENMTYMICQRKFVIS